MACSDQSNQLLRIGGWAAAGRQDRSVVLCAKIGKCTCTLYEQKNPVCIQILRAYTGIGDAETPSPGGCVNPIPRGMRKPNPRGDAETPSPGMLRKLGDLPLGCPRPKKFKRLATRDTLHGSRPNLRQRDPNGRIVPTPPNVSYKGVSTKRCARRKKNHNDTHTCFDY